jgi:hypothetical protein
MGMDLTSSGEKTRNARKVDGQKKDEMERLVTRHIRDHFSFLVIPIDAEKADRFALEERLISTTSLCTICNPSSSWLGLYSPVEKIRQS